MFFRWKREQVAQRGKYFSLWKRLSLSKSTNSILSSSCSFLKIWMFSVIKILYFTILKYAFRNAYLILKCLNNENIIVNYKIFLYSISFVAVSSEEKDFSEMKVNNNFTLTLIIFLSFFVLLIFKLANCTCMPFKLGHQWHIFPIKSNNLFWSFDSFRDEIIFFRLICRTT